MDMPESTLLGRQECSARELLQRFYYGHSEQVEFILKFARDRRLEDDDLVFLLVSILKGNEELVRCILLAIDGTERVIDNSREAGTKLRGLAQNLIAQMNDAANQSSGRLNLAADRLTETVARADQLCNNMDAAARSMTQVEGALDRGLEIKSGKHALDRLIDQIRRQAQADLRGYHAEIVDGLAHRVGRQVRVIHIYGIVGLITCGWVLLAQHF